MELLCVKCEKPLSEVPVYNNEEDDKFPSSFLFCTNEKCENHGLLTLVFKTGKKIAKSKRKKI